MALSLRVLVVMENPTGIDPRALRDFDERLFTLEFSWPRGRDAGHQARAAEPKICQAVLKGPVSGKLELC